MKSIRFSIQGNQKDPKGNPIPYKRTLKGKFRQDAKDYMEWKEYVRTCFDRTSEFLNDYDPPQKYKPYWIPKYMPYPLLVGEYERAAVHITIFWRDGRHGDGDNILKGIMDSLFQNDKCVWAGSFKSEYSLDGKGIVDVLLEIDEEKI